MANDLVLEGGGWRDCDLNTDSLWLIDKRDKSGVHRGDYHGNFVPQIPNEFIRRFTKEGDWVLDVFVGSGTSLMCAKELGRHAVGFDVSPKALEICRERVALTEGKGQVSLVEADCLDGASYLGMEGKFELVFVHPPYLDIVNFSDDERCLGNRVSGKTVTQQISEFEEMMLLLGSHLRKVMQPGGHLVYVIGDIYKQREWHLLGFRSWATLQVRSGCVLKGLVVKNVTGNERVKGSKANLWRYRHLKNGTFDFKHEYIFVGRKDG